MFEEQLREVTEHKSGQRLVLVLAHYDDTKESILLQDSLWVSPDYTAVTTPIFAYWHIHPTSLQPDHFDLGDLKENKEQEKIESLQEIRLVEEVEEVDEIERGPNILPTPDSWVEQITCFTGVQNPITAFVPGHQRQNTNTHRRTAAFRCHNIYNSTIIWAFDFPNQGLIIDGRPVLTEKQLTEILDQNYV